MMNIHYLILAHKEPEQLQLLINTLETDTSKFYIHIDKNSDIKPFKNALNEYDHVNILEDALRQAGTWGDLGIVKATLSLMRCIEDARNNDIVVLLSGQDYALRSNDDIKEKLNVDQSTCFITKFPVPIDGWLEKGLNRIKKYKVNISAKRGDFVIVPTIYQASFYRLETLKKLYSLYLNDKARKIWLIFKPRRLPYGLKPFGGAQWWAMTYDLCRSVLQYEATHPKFTQFHEYSLLPDEMFFQTILMELDEKGVDINFEKSLTYTNWTAKNRSLPVTFLKSDEAELKQASNDHLFARKFDPSIDKEIIVKLPFQ